MVHLSADTAEAIGGLVARLLRQWREETRYLSSSTAMTGNVAYLDLIALGPVALPFLFRDIEQTGDGHLSKALTEITGAHPVPAEERGHVRKVAERWLHWARENGYQW
ncbi:MAG: hypothetical protein U0793_26200 [Gemmataceae bacterium]